MVKHISIGVLGIQGAVSEHIASMSKALKEANTPGRVFVVKRKEDIKTIDALILPGGESTNISKLLHQSEIHDAILQRVQEKNLPIMGTCAGCVLLAKELTDNTNEVELLYAMNMQVERNAFGRQKESFEQTIAVKGFSQPYHAVFIRAPIITKLWSNGEILAKINKKIIMARQDKFLALSFHPELTDDLRIHKYFLSMI